MRRLLILVALATAAAAAPAHADTYPCLKRFVERGAYPGDTVCVTPKVRAQVLADNAAAQSRIDPNSAWGPQGCKVGYVWRVARPSDLVCVTPATRSQTASDNAAAANRLNSVRTTVDRYHANDAFRYRVLVNNINQGPAFLGLYRMSDRKLLASWRSTFGIRLRGTKGYPFLTGKLVCNGRANAYFRVKDLTSNVWGPRVEIVTGCSGY